MKTLALLLFACAVSVWGQTVAAPIPVANQQFLDCRTGACLPLNGGKLFSYTAGTLTPKVTYTDSTGTTPNANPVVLNSSGFNAAGSGNAGVWIKNACYKFILKDSANVVLWTQDNVCNQEALGIAALTASLASSTGSTMVGFTQTGASTVQTVAGKLSEVLSVKDFGAKGDGTTDDTTAINSAIAAMQTPRPPTYPSTASRVLLFPPGVYSHTGLTISGTMYITGQNGSGATATLLYTGTDTAVTLNGQPSGYIGDLNILSTLGSAGTTLGIDLSGGTELTISHVQVGSGPASSFATGLKVRTTGITHIDYFSSSWCPTGMLFDVDSFATADVFVTHGNFFAAAVAGVDVRDTGALTIADSFFEAVQTAVLIENSNGAGITTGLKIINNSASLITSFAGLIFFTNPQFLTMKGANAGNSLLAQNVQVEKNNVGGSPGNYCNTLTTTLTFPGNLDNFFFTGNQWSGCTVAAINADNRVYITAQNEVVPGGVVEFSGAMYGTDLEPNTGGQLVLKQYQAGAYLTPYTIKPIVAADVTAVGGVVLTTHSGTPAASACGTGPSGSASGNDRAGQVTIGGGSVASCTITFATPFNSQPIGAYTQTFNFGGGGTPPYTFVPTFSGGVWVGFTITGTNLAANQFSWTYPFAN